MTTRAGDPYYWCDGLFREPRNDAVDDSITKDGNAEHGREAEDGCGGNDNHLHIGLGISHGNKWSGQCEAENEFLNAIIIHGPQNERFWIFGEGPFSPPIFSTKHEAFSSRQLLCLPFRKSSPQSS